jgi:hypothetical protein
VNKREKEGTSVFPLQDVNIPWLHLPFASLQSQLEHLPLEVLSLSIKAILLNNPPDYV